MKNLNISILGVLLWVSAAGVGLAGLRNASEAWSIALRALNTGCLVIAPLLVVIRTGQTRATSAGFAIFGWAYLVLSMPVFDKVDVICRPHEFARAMLGRLDLVRKYPPLAVGQRVDVIDFSKEPQDFVRGTLIREYAKGCFEVALDDGRELSECRGAFRLDNREYYLSVGNTLACLLFALLGSILARCLFKEPATREESSRLAC